MITAVICYIALNILNTNPYDPPNGSSQTQTDSAIDRSLSRRNRVFKLWLILSGALLSVPPIPLAYWLSNSALSEGSPLIQDLLFAASLTTGLAWAIWAGSVVLGVLSRQIGYVWLVTILYASIASGTSILGAYCYLTAQSFF